ncbi:MAG: phosphopantetheine-binding protein, partial [Cyanobacteria bacterium P01_G01_bin.19]
RIVAYVKGDRNLVQGISENLIASKLRHYLELKLPYYMIPDDFIFLEAFPLSPNGKLDLKTLPKPQIKTKTYIAPRNELEQQIVSIWQDVLQINKIGIEDNFFELGGNSLSATRVNSRLREVLSIELPLKSIFENPTVDAIAKKVTLLNNIAKNQNINFDDDLDNESKRVEFEI